MNLLTVPICIGLFASCQCFMFNDECTLYPKWPSHHEASDTEEITVPTSCRNGTVYWNYPQGKVVVHFPLGGTFSVCIVNGLGGQILTAVDISGRCYKTLTAISQTPICVDAIGGRADIMFQAPDTMFYITAVDYYVDDHKGIRC